MALYKYFKRDSSFLHDLYGPLPSLMSSSVIASANVEVKSIIEETKTKTSSTKRGCFANYSEEEKAKVAKRATDMGVTNSLRHFTKEFVDRPLKVSTVRTWVKKYTKELESRKRHNKDMAINKLTGRNEDDHYF